MRRPIGSMHPGELEDESRRLLDFAAASRHPREALTTHLRDDEEHFDVRWEPMLDHNVDEPAHPFRPYGATVGHGFEWARLALHVCAADVRTDGRRLPGAAALFDRAVADGWWADGEPGFVYTTDCEGHPVVRSRLHGVVTEAIYAAAALYLATGDEQYEAWYRDWWGYANRFLIDDDGGSWHHELDAHNRPAASVWSGKPVHDDRHPRCRSGGGRAARS